MPTSSIPSGGGGGLQPKYQKFTSSGTFTLPDGYGAAKPLLINIQVIGGGGGGSRQSLASASLTASGSQVSYFGSGSRSAATNAITGVTLDATNTIDGYGGGSGGIAATQMYLTSNLSITVGAAGSTGTYGGTWAQTSNSWANDHNNNNNKSWSGVVTNVTFSAATVNSGTGGTTIAGSVSSAGGVGAAVNNIILNGTWAGSTNWNSTGNFSASGIAFNSVGGGVGAGGTPSGTAGAATPLLGTLAGGSNNTTSVFGSFGIGGKRGDGNTSTGVEGTGGGAGAVGAPGAVIITWWQ
jgi:hypothetical protein